MQLTRAMTLQLMRKSLGLSCMNDVLVLPLATGMALTMSFLTLISENPGKKFVIFPRIDQKTCLKSIYAANLTPIVVEQKLVGDEL